MKLLEFRFVVPFSFEEFERGHMYMVNKLSNQETSGDAGVEVLVDENREHPEKGPGRYTQKKYHLGSRLPGWLCAVLPKTALVLDEAAWRLDEYTWTNVTSEYMKDNMTMLVESMHIPKDKGTIDNVFKLNEKQLKMREVIHVDIAVEGIDRKSSEYKPEEDPAVLKLNKAKRGPLTPGWQDNLDKADHDYICVYKLFTCNFKWFGLQGRIESFICNYEKGLFAKGNRMVYCWSDEWWDLSKKELRRINRETARKQNANFGGNEAQFDSDSDSDEDGDDDGAADEGDHSKKKKHHRKHVKKVHRKHKHHHSPQPQTDDDDNDDDKDDVVDDKQQ